MNQCHILLMCSALVLGSFARAQEVDSGITTIKNIDLSDDKPSSPTHVLLTLNVKKLKVPGARGSVIIYQFSNRVRIEFEGAGLPFGKYGLSVADSCQSGGWTELHEFTSSSTHIATEHSLPKVSLRKTDKPGMRVLEGKGMGLFRKQNGKSSLVDCQIVR